MPKYPNKQLVIDALVETARRAAMESNADHPEDIAVTMMNAIEYGGSVITTLYQMGKL